MASGLSYILPIIGIVTYFLFTGTQAGFHYILFFCSAFGAVVFERRRKMVVATSMVFPLLIFIILDFFGDSLVIRQLFSDSILPYLRVLGIFIAFLCTLATVSIYVYQQTRLVLEKQKKSIKTTIKLNHVFNEIKEKNNLLEDYSSKAAYVSMTQGLAHEIRSTMTCLMSGAELLSEKDNQDQVQQFSDMMIKAIKRLTVLTKSMLTFGKNMSQEATSFSINQLLEELVSLAKCYCSEKQIELKIQLDNDCELVANRVYLAQAFLNIMVNAIDYSNKRDTIYVKSKVEVEANEISIIIQDTGCGMSVEKKHKIFEKHYSSGRETHNSGLGLSLVKRVIDDHKGTIVVDSEKGKGTVFTIKLQLEA